MKKECSKLGTGQDLIELSNEAESFPHMLWRAFSVQSLGSNLYITKCEGTL